MTKVFIFTLFIFCFSASESLANVRFEVLKIDGLFWYWSDLNSDWEPILEGSVIPNGTLVQSLSSGNIRLSKIDRNGSRYDFSLISESSLICRLNSDIIRDFSISKLYMKDLSRSLGKKNDDKLNLATAWKRNHILYSTLAKSKKGGNKPSSKEGLNPLNSKENQSTEQGISLIHPKPGSILVFDRFPALVPIVWSNNSSKGQNLNYRVYLGLDNIEENLPLVATTKDSYVTVPIEEEGSYRLAFSQSPNSPPVVLGTFYVIHTSQSSVSTRSDP